MKEGGLDGLPQLQYCNFLSLSDNESVTVSPVIIVHTLRKNVELKKCQSSQVSLAPWSHDTA